MNKAHVKLKGFLLFCTLMLGCGHTAPEQQTSVVQQATTQPSVEERIRRIQAALVQDAWARVLSRRPVAMQIYRFLPNGEFQKTIKSDVRAAKELGTWRLTSDANGNVHLNLKGPERFYWLVADSIIEYEPTSDKMLFSGPPYDGKQAMERYRATDPE